MLKLINKILSKLPFLSSKGVFMDYSTNYKLINPNSLRGSRKGHGVILSYLIGNEIVELIKVHTNYKNDETILDAGCGDGRVASTLLRSNFKGKYYGFDINKRRLKELRIIFKNNLNINFTYVDIYHSYYNRKGNINPEEFVYPYDNCSSGLIIYNSIFSHQKISVIKHNLIEAKRVLKKDGRIWCTFYIKDDNYDSKQDNPSNRFFETVYDKGYTAVPEKPESAVGYDYGVITNLIDEIELKIIKYIPGFWKKDRESRDQHEQDVFVLSKNSII